MHPLKDEIPTEEDFVFVQNLRKKHPVFQLSP
jgi:hypothetical protein